jgi:tRNA-Thr(GGU) m(6)t(6)A37 methyltransferase TsaA
MNDGTVNRDRVEAILSYMMEHHEGHESEHAKWLQAVQEFGNDEITRELQTVAGLFGEIREHVHRAQEALHGTEAGEGRHKALHEGASHHHIQFHRIGTIYTPYTPDTPSAEMKGPETACRVEIDERFVDGLWRLDGFRYVIVMFHLDRERGTGVLRVTPPWAGGMETGVFASRSPLRPNPIGISIVGLRQIRGNVLHTDNIDAYDGTPLLDVKPYLEAVDSKAGAGNGWIDELDEDVKSRAFNLR